MRAIIAGGGTAGHINPGLSIAKQIMKKHPGSEILFIGTQKGLETKLVPMEGFKLELIRVKGFRRKLSLDTLSSVKELFQGLLEARKIIREFKPDIVIGTGGYVCGPVVLNAALMRIPTLIHEQNAFPGATNRILSRFTDAVAISFKESEKYFKGAKKLIFTGNPVREEIAGADRISSREKLGIQGKTPFVVVFGGSLGAGKINDTVLDMLMKNDVSHFRMLFGTGNNGYRGIMDRIGSRKPSAVEIVPYIYDMGDVMAAADIAVCRAGAITCSELAVLGVPSIMIPSPNVVANHQEYNARSLEKQGAAVVILEKDLNSTLLYSQIQALLSDREQLGKMVRNAKKAGVADAADKIHAIITELVKAVK